MPQKNRIKSVSQFIRSV